jgi:flagellar hook-associated protein 1 FlgK
MGSLNAALSTAAGSLDVLEQAIGTVQNNVSNASTPGYVTQTVDLTARRFDSTGDLAGGVESNGIDSSRSIFAEEAVWNANQQVGLSTQQASSLNSLQTQFDVSGTSGLPAALSSLYSAFSAWSSNPTDTTSRQQVLSAATTLAQQFNETANNVNQLSTQTNQQLSSTVTQINSLSSQIAGINGEIKNGGSTDAGAQSQLYNALESLSNLVPITVSTASDGTSTVLLAGQSPLVVGSDNYNLSVDYPADPNATYAQASPNAQLLTSDGQDVTSLASQGQLGGLLSFRNQTIPSVIGNTQQQGSLNQLAQGLADRVNTILTGGEVSAGPPAVSGTPLFSYSTASGTDVAGSLSLDSSISASTLAAISPGPPAVANGTASQLANLSTSQAPADQINGLTYTDFYSSIASSIGQQQSTASAAQQAQSQVLTQAQNLRAQTSGVSLNDQAALLLQYQQNYQAASQVISTVNTLTQDLLTVMENLSKA